MEDELLAILRRGRRKLADACRDDRKECCEYVEEHCSSDSRRLLPSSHRRAMKESRGLLDLSILREEQRLSRVQKESRGYRRKEDQDEEVEALGSCHINLYGILIDFPHDPAG